MPFRNKHRILTSYLKGKSPVFWPWTFGNLRYCLSAISAWARPDFDQGDQHRKQRKMLNPVFSIAHMRKMGMYSSLFLDKSTNWCASPDILWRLLQGTTRLIHFILSHHILTLFVPKLRASFAHQVKDGPREVCSSFNPVSNFSFSCLQIEVLSWMGRTALELIGQSGLGYSFDPLTEDGVPHSYSTTVKLFAYVYLPVIMGLSSDFADNHTQGQLYSR